MDVVFIFEHLALFIIIFSAVVNFIAAIKSTSHAVLFFAALSAFCIMVSAKIALAIL